MRECINSQIALFDFKASYTHRVGPRCTSCLLLRQEDSKRMTMQHILLDATIDCPVHEVFPNAQ